VPFEFNARDHDYLEARRCFTQVIEVGYERWHLVGHDLIEVCKAFPMAAPDDPVDATTQAHTNSAPVATQ